MYQNTLGVVFCALLRLRSYAISHQNGLYLDFVFSASKHRLIKPEMKVEV
jgi:hypothetical protein